ncbi:DUF3592 domain-containing protein [Streptomyces sp. NBC_00727]|uniref:DUF3592 domain-containing protein n=1 Tax=Streptomyces sp. NBC_00727 TaxID=2903675 RepID=UPI00386542D3
MPYVNLAASGSPYFIPHAVIVLGVAGIVARFAGEAYALRSRGVRARGVCVRHTYAKNGVSVVARFQTASGETFRALGPAGAVASARVGDPVDVVYDPRKPKNAKVEPANHSDAHWLAFVALVLAVPGVWLLWWVLVG